MYNHGWGRNSQIDFLLLMFLFTSWYRSISSFLYFRLEEKIKSPFSCWNVHVNVNVNVGEDSKVRFHYKNTIFNCKRLVKCSIERMTEPLPTRTSCKLKRLIPMKNNQSIACHRKPDHRVKSRKLFSNCHHMNRKYQRQLTTTLHGEL